ncbi:MAG: hypothetical protein ACK2TX_05565, partial [Anaerolineales bacterium]
MKIRVRKGIWLALLLIAGILLSSCGSGSAEGTPTISAEQVQTQAVATFAAGLTATSQALPTATP